MRDELSVPDSGVTVSPGSHQTILWIDDQPDEAGLLRFLSLEGFRVATATTGTAGLALAGANQYDAIVVDLHLPDLHGFTVIERLRAGAISCPVVAVTGHYLDLETPQHAREAGATAFQYKPLWLDETAELLRAVGGHTSGGTPMRPFPPESGVQSSGHSLPHNVDSEKMAIARLLARLDRLVATAPADPERPWQDVLLAALLSALADPALPLAGVNGCAQALHMIPGSASVRREELAAEARESVRQATRRPLTARHPSVRKALAVLLEQPRWWDEEDLAKEVSASRSHFARIVHQDTGLEYWTLRRLVVMKAGVIDVLTSDEQFAQIAYRLGMRPGDFDEVFSETFGACPRELRRLWARLTS